MNYQTKHLLHAMCPGNNTHHNPYNEETYILYAMINQTKNNFTKTRTVCYQVIDYDVSSFDFKLCEICIT